MRCSRSGLAGQEVTWVGLHNRRGDYRFHLQFLYDQPLLSPGYFNRSMQHFMQQVPAQSTVLPHHFNS